MRLKGNRPALFIMPRSSQAWQGSEALWITVGGWAAAAKRKFGASYVLTTDRLVSSEEVLDYPLGHKSKNRRSKSWYRFIPKFLFTLIKDILLWRASKKKSNYNYEIPGLDEGISMVWEHHDLFSGPGRKIADTYKVPLIRYVHAPQVWESGKWEVKRPIWGRWLESQEAKSLKQADLVACVSHEVYSKLIDMGIDEDKMIICPMAVDPYLFDSNTQKSLRKILGLEEKIVLGWTGSFRNFHGMDILVEAFAMAYQVEPRLHLLLVGDGLVREAIEELVHEKELENAVTFVGRKAFKEMPDYVSVFDIAIVSARSKVGFHYSPLKLREYLAAGKATLAPNAGEIPNNFEDNRHLQLYNVGDKYDMCEKIIRLSSDHNMRNILAEEGKKFILECGTWDVELKKATEKL